MYWQTADENPSAAGARARLRPHLEGHAEDRVLEDPREGRGQRQAGQGRRRRRGRQAQGATRKGPGRGRAGLSSTRSSTGRVDDHTGPPRAAAGLAFDWAAGRCPYFPTPLTSGSAWTQLVRETRRTFRDLASTTRAASRVQSNPGFAAETCARKCVSGLVRALDSCYGSACRQARRRLLWAVAPALSLTPVRAEAVDFEQPVPEVGARDRRSGCARGAPRSREGPVRFVSRVIEAPARFDLVGIGGELRPVEYRARA